MHAGCQSLSYSCWNSCRPSLFVAVLKHDDPEIKVNVALTYTQLIYLFLVQNSQYTEVPQELV